MENNVRSCPVEKLSSIWKEVLDVSDISGDDNFFSLGGHSLLAMELLNAIEDKFLLRLNMHDIVESPSIIALSQLIQERKNLEDTLGLNLQSFQDGGCYPLTLNQKQVWSLNALNPGSLTHNLSTALRIKRPLCENTINNALNYIVDRQDVLKTRFKIVNGAPVQEIVQDLNYQISFIDIKEDELLSTLHGLMKKPFNLKNDPLMRIQFFRLAPDEYIFFFMVHHIIWDGLSNTMFFHEFNHCYEAFLEGKRPGLPPVKKTLKEYALKEAEYLSSEEIKGQKEEWRKLLHAPLPRLNLPTDFPRKEPLSNEVKTYLFEIQGDLFHELEEYAKKKHLSLYNVLITAYQITLSALSGNLDIIIGTPVHGRHQRDTRQTFGYFINTLPIRTKLASGLSFLDNLKLVMETLKNAFYNQNVPIDLIIRTAFENSGYKEALFQTLFIYLDVTKELDLFKDLKYEQVKINRPAGHTEIDFYLYKSRNKIEVAVEYKKDLFLESSIERLSQKFLEIIKSFLANENVKLSALGVKPSDANPPSPEVKSAPKKRGSLRPGETSRFVMDLWKEVLGIELIDPDENFFDYGGHSILAIEIFTRINDHFHLELSLSSIFEGLTVNSLSELIEQELKQVSPPHLLDLKCTVLMNRPSFHWTPLFCFHGVGGNILNYYPLSELSETRPFFGIQSPGVTQAKLTPLTLSEMAKVYKEEIQLIQPQGPYILAGGSMGGMVALEVALQLKQEGQTVSHLIMFDTFGPDLEAIQEPFFSFRKVRERFASLRKSLMIKYYHFKKKPLPGHLRFFEVERNNALALKNYRPRPYHGNLTLIRAPLASRGHYADPYLGWKNTITGNIQVIEVQGQHENLIEGMSFTASFKKVLEDLPQSR